MINVFDLNCNHAVRASTGNFREEPPPWHYQIALPFAVPPINLDPQLMNPETRASPRQIGANTRNIGVVTSTGSRSYQ